LPTAKDLIAGRLYYSVHYAGEEAMHAPVVISLPYTGIQNEEGLYIFRPLPLGNSEIGFEPEAIEASILDLDDLKRELAGNASSQRDGPGHPPLRYGDA
jgi:hypothetical protein